MGKEMKGLTDLQADALNELAACKKSRIKWATPMEIGGSNGSSLSMTLKGLTKKGYVEWKQRGASDDMIGHPASAIGMRRGSKCYRITTAGEEAIARHNARMED